MAAVDNSEYAQSVAREVARLAPETNADVILVSVVPVPALPASNGDIDSKSLSEEEKEFQDLHKTLIESYFVPSSGVMVESKILHGNPGDKIVEYADKAEADLIVVGSRGRGKLASAVLGSVSEHVVHKSKRSVLVVKQTAI